jgi:hypothetical protein
MTNDDTTVSFYTDDPTLVGSIEHVLRERHARLANIEKTCWITYHYQTLQPVSGRVDTLVPVFSILSVFDGDFFLVTERPEVMAVTEGLHVALSRVELCRIDNPSFIEKFPLFELKNKKTKKIVFPFKKFSIGTVTVFLGTDGFVSFQGIGARQLARDIVAQKKFTNLDSTIGSLRPLNNPELVFAFHIYELSKRKDTVTIPRPSVPSKLCGSL